MNADKTVTCKVCQKEIVCPGFLGHIKRRHPREYDDYMRSRAEFGISIFNHVAVGYVDVPAIRQ